MDEKKCSHDDEDTEAERSAKDRRKQSNYRKDVLDMLLETYSSETRFTDDDRYR
jgi:hypothetical protein